MTRPDRMTRGRRRKPRPGRHRATRQHTAPDYTLSSIVAVAVIGALLTLGSLR